MHRAQNLQDDTQGHTGSDDCGSAENTGTLNCSFGAFGNVDEHLYIVVRWCHIFFVDIDNGKLGRKVLAVLADALLWVTKSSKSDTITVLLEASRHWRVEQQSCEVLERTTDC